MKPESEYNNGAKTIKMWADEDRPREKLILKGKAALSDMELVAILLGTGTRSQSAVDLARLMLMEAKNDLNILARYDLAQFQKFKGIGKAKAITLISAFELCRRRRELLPGKKHKIRASQDVYELMKPELCDQRKEYFWVLLLNRANQVMARKLISQGGISGTVADPKLIFKFALEELASSIILVHNHPSGNLQPSEADIRLTRQMKKSGEALEISVLDHLIFTDDGYFSFADESLL